MKFKGYRIVCTNSFNIVEMTLKLIFSKLDQPIQSHRFSFKKSFAIYLSLYTLIGTFSFLSFNFTI